MRLISKGPLLVGLAILAVAGIALYQRPQVQQYLDRKTEQLLPKEASQTRFYKWRDNKGRWQLSDAPPPPGVPYETTDINHNTNVMPSEAITGKKKP